MSETAVHAAHGMGVDDLAVVSRQLAVLRRKWGGDYCVGHDAEHGWWATRYGRIGHIIAAGEPGELDYRLTDELGPGAP
jgi:hypothetical protein